jgi:hypothetical protein
MSKAPKISLGRGVHPDVKRAIQAMLDFMQANSLSSSQASALIASAVAGAVGGGSGGSGGSGDLTVPEQPTNFTVTGLFNAILLTWGSSASSNYAYTEIWRIMAWDNVNAFQQDDVVYYVTDGHAYQAVQGSVGEIPASNPTYWTDLGTDIIGNASLVATSIATGFTDIPPNTSLSATYYYWIRFISTAGIAGPFDSTAGTPGSTADEPDYLMSIISGEIEKSDLAQALQTEINSAGSFPEWSNTEDYVAGNTVQYNGHIYLCLLDHEVADEGPQIPSSSPTYWEDIGTITTVTDLIGSTTSQVIQFSDQYTVKIDNNGYVTGFGLSTEDVDGVPFSRFLVNADQFAVINPNTNQQAITSLARGTSPLPSGKYRVTANVTSHPFEVGDYVVISGAAQHEYNGTQKITVKTATTFSYEIDAAPDTPATAKEGFTIKFGEAVIPFIIDNGIVYMSTAYIKNGTITNLMVENIGADKINAGIITNTLTIIGSRLRSADSTVVLDMGTKTFDLINAPGEYVHMSPTGIEFIYGGEGYKSVKRVVTGYGTNDTFIPFDPDFKQAPQVLISPKNFPTYFDEYDGGDATGTPQIIVMNVEAVYTTGFRPKAYLTFIDGLTQTAATGTSLSAGYTFFITPYNDCTEAGLLCKFGYWQTISNDPQSPEMDYDVWQPLNATVAYQNTSGTFVNVFTGSTPSSGTIIWAGEVFDPGQTIQMRIYMASVGDSSASTWHMQRGVAPVIADGEVNFIAIEGGF